MSPQIFAATLIIALLVGSGLAAISVRFGIRLLFKNGSGFPWPRLRGAGLLLVGGASALTVVAYAPYTWAVLLGYG